MKIFAKLRGLPFAPFVEHLSQNNDYIFNPFTIDLKSNFETDVEIKKYLYPNSEKKFERGDHLLHLCREH